MMKRNYHLRAIIFLMLCIVCTKVFAQKQGQEKIDSLILTIDLTREDSTQVNKLLDIAWKLNSRNPDTSIILYNQAILLAQKINWILGTGQAFYEIGLVYYQKGNFSKALQSYNESLKFLEKMRTQNPNYQQEKLDEKKAKTIGVIGNVYKAQGDYPNALTNYLKALKMEEKLQSKIGIARQSTNLGVIYLENNQYSKALNYFTNALMINESVHDSEGIARQLGNIGNVYYAQHNYSISIDYYFKTLKIFTDLKNENNSAAILSNIASIYAEQKKYEMSEKYFLEALLKVKKIGNKQYMASILGNIGSLNTLMGKYTEGEINLKQALKIAIEIGSIDLQKEHYTYLYDLYYKKGDFKKAIDYYKKAIANKDSLFNENKTREITQKEMQYSFDKQQDSVKVIQDKKDTQAKAEMEKQKLLLNSIAGGAGIISLSALLSFVFYKRKRDAVQLQKETALSLQVSETEMKALRSQMNPHFIFNALQSIQTFLLSHKSEEANLYLLKFSKLMRAVLENSQHREVPLQKDMQALELYMQLESIRLPHPFTYAFHIDETIDVEEVTIPPLILQPFVENAIWHGLQYKPEPGHINIYLSKRDNALHAIVEDNGVGRDMSKQVQQPMLLKKESLGMKLTEERLKILNELKKIKAQFKIIDLLTKENKPAGTKVEILLPLVAQ